MTSLAAAKAANAAVKLPFAPVAVFVGGTSGLGQVRDHPCIFRFYFSHSERRQ